MALTTPTPKQVGFAKQVAWERGVTLHTIPDTSSALSGVIDEMLALPSLPVEDRQVSQIRELTAECVARIPDFVPRDDIPETRSEANQRIFSLRKRLSAVEFYAAKEAASSYFSLPGETATPAAVESDLDF